MKWRIDQAIGNLLASAFVCAIGIAAVWHIVNTALEAGIDGSRMALGIGVILAIVLAFTGVKLKDVLIK